ncbi:hypothetical protein FRB97_006178 [Tulasnella sp. 331]|nr:hypothetical protein FRB97_006178 [Tulasnella sp. 331]
MSSELDLGWSYLNAQRDPNDGKTPNVSVDPYNHLDPFGHILACPTLPPPPPTRIYTSIPAQGMPHPITFPDFEGRAVEDELEPPEINIVKRALSMLVDSTQSINNTRLSMITGNSNSDECVNGRMSELIKVACQALVREADIQSSDLRHEHDARALAYRRRRDAQVAELAYRQNTLAPINNLPFEVLSDIIVLTVATSVGSIHKVLLTLATVVKHWKEVVFSTPRLWSKLEESMSPTQLELAISRSSTTRLDILLPGKGLSEDGGVKRNEFVARVIPFVQRWRTLDGLQVPDSVLDILEFEAPALQTIRLRRWGRDEISRFGLGIGARLRSLELSRVATTNWDSTRIGGLVSLSLSFIPEQDAPSLTQLCCIIADSPDLEELALNDVAVRPPAESDILSKGTFPSSQRLTMLKLKRIPCTSYNHLLARLHFPNCPSIELQPDPPTPTSARPSASNGSDTYRHDTPTFARQVERALLVDGAIFVSLGEAGRRAAYLSSYGWHQDIGSERSGPGFSLLLWPILSGPGESRATFPLGAITGVVELVRRANPESTNVHLSISLGLNRPDFPLEFLTALSHSVISLSLSGDAGFRAVMWYLGQRQASHIDAGDGEGAWLFPRLKKIDLWASYSNLSVVAIRKMVQDRWVKYTDRGSNTRPEGYVEVKVPIQKGGKTEYWKPVVMEKKSGRKKAPVSEDESDDEADLEFQE